MSRPVPSNQLKTPLRAAQIWPLLAWCALHRQTIIYEELGGLIGVPPAGLSGFLDAIDAYCVHADLPRLAALAVSKQGNVPGSGFPYTDGVALVELHARAFAWNWLASPSPTPEGFGQLLKA